MYILLIVIIILCFCVVSKSSLTDKPRPIPKIIHKIILLNDKNITTYPPDLQRAINSFKELNPDYELRVYNYNDCLRYIYQHFGPRMVEYFEKLKPYAYKSDLMRMLLLYNEGGFYSDMKEVCLKSFDEVFPKDMTWFSAYDRPVYHMLNAFIAAPPHHPWIRNTIQLIIHNIDNRYYGNSPLYPTGPAIFFIGCDLKNKKPTDCFGRFEASGIHRIYYKDTAVIQNKYDNGKSAWSNSSGNDYSEMWDKNDVYEKDT